MYFYEDNASSATVITLLGNNGIANSVWSSNVVYTYGAVFYVYS